MSETGLPPFGSFHGSDFENVSLRNGNLHVEIPLIKLPQRAAPSFGVKLVYDMPTFEVDKSNPTPTTTQWTAAPVPGEKVYWNYLNDPDGPAAFKHDTISKTCTYVDAGGRRQTASYQVHTNYVVIDRHGTQHPFNLRHVVELTCPLALRTGSYDTNFS